MFPEPEVRYGCALRSRTFLRLKGKKGGFYPGGSEKTAKSLEIFLK